MEDQEQKSLEERIPPIHVEQNPSAETLPSPLFKFLKKECSILDGYANNSVRVRITCVPGTSENSPINGYLNHVNRISEGNGKECDGLTVQDPDRDYQELSCFVIDIKSIEVLNGVNGMTMQKTVYRRT